MQIGISDFFFAEVQKGLAPGEVVMLEVPKDEKITVAKTPPVVRTAGTAAAEGLAKSGRVGDTQRVGTGASKLAIPTAARPRGGS